MASIKPLAPENPDLKVAIARGYEEGLSNGRAAAAEELKTALAAALAEAREAGRREGVVELTIATDAIRVAVAQFDQTIADFALEAETFCVNLTLAALAKIAEVDSVRSDFVKRAIVAALATLAPRQPIAVLLNPSAAETIKPLFPDLPIRADDTIAAGQVRIDGGRLLIESGIADALEEVRDAVFTVQARRARPDFEPAPTTPAPATLEAPQPAPAKIEPAPPPPPAMTPEIIQATPAQAEAKPIKSAPVKSAPSKTKQTAAVQAKSAQAKPTNGKSVKAKPAPPKPVSGKLARRK